MTRGADLEPWQVWPFRDPWHEYNVLLHAVRRSIFYHDLSAAQNARLHRLIGFLAVTSGASAVGALMRAYPSAGLWLVAAATALQALDLFVNFAQRANNQVAMKRAFQDLCVEMTERPVSRENVRRWMVKRLELEKLDESRLNPVLNSICRNQVAQADKIGIEHQCRISPWQRFLATYLGIAWRPASIRTWAEIVADQRLGRGTRFCRALGRGWWTAVPPATKPQVGAVSDQPQQPANGDVTKPTR